MRQHRCITGSLATMILVVATAACGGTDLVDSSADNQTSSDVPDSERSITGTAGTTIYLPPADIQEFVNRRDAVVLATVGQVVSNSPEPPYGPDGLPLAGDPHSLTFTRYTLHIERVFVDDGNINSAPVLRLFGPPEATGIVEGERLLLALGRNSDSASYGLSGNWAALTVDGSGVRDFSGRSVEYASKTSPEGFLRTVENAANRYEPLPRSEWTSR